MFILIIQKHSSYVSLFIQSYIIVIIIKIYPTRYRFWIICIQVLIMDSNKSISHRWWHFRLFDFLHIFFQFKIWTGVLSLILSISLIKLINLLRYVHEIADSTLIQILISLLAILKSYWIDFGCLRGVATHIIVTLFDKTFSTGRGKFVYIVDVLKYAEYFSFLLDHVIHISMIIFDRFRYPFKIHLIYWIASI